MRFSELASIFLLAITLLFVAPPAISKEGTSVLKLRGFVSQSENQREGVRESLEDRSCTKTDQVRCKPARKHDVDRGRMSIFQTRTITLE